MEPSSTNKRRRIADKLRGHDHTPFLSLADIKARLKNIRRVSTEHLNSHGQTLLTNLNKHTDVKVMFANSAVQAAAEIKRINEGRQIAINKSAVIANEIVPELVKYNLNIIETYYDEFKPFDNQLDEHLRLPNLDIESVLNAFQIASHPDISRKECVAKNGSKDFTGLIGIAAISASDGNVSLFQHMGNTGTVYEQAQKIILVAGLDKIVWDKDDAVFQTKCMAAFGWKGLPRPKNLYYKPNAGISIRNMPYEISPEDTEQEVHLILLDNGRTKIQKSEYKDLLTCIGCRACTINCPVSTFFHSSGKWNPKEYLYHYVQGRNPSTDLCLQCKTCRMNCPLDIDIPGLILNARADAMKNGKLPLMHSLLSNFENIAKWSSKTPFLANTLSKNALVRNLGETFTGVSSKRKMPEFQNLTFKKWFENRKNKEGHYNR